MPSPQEVPSKRFRNEEINMNFGKPGPALTQMPSLDEFGRDKSSVTGAIPRTKWAGAGN